MGVDHVTAVPAPVSDTGSSLGADGDHAEDPVPSRRRFRRRRLLAGAVVLAGVAAALAATRGGGDGEGDGSAAASTTTAEVEARDLVVTDEFEGQLGFGQTDAVTASRSAVVTGVTAAGTTVKQGEVLFQLDLQPTVLLHGDIPAFRELSIDADPGTDVTQLEQALVELGFADDVTVDTEFDEATAAAVEAWEKSLGRSDPDGVVALGDVVFAPADLRVAEVTADRGTQVQSGGEIVQVTTTTKQVTLQLALDEVANVEAGTPVTIALPDHTEVAGTIADVASEPTSDDTAGGGGGDDDEDTYAVAVTFDDPTVAASFESGSVDVTVERSRTEHATAVPVIALLALREGGYAVEVVDDTEPDGVRLVPVEVGTLADEWVEVSGDGVEAGVEVVVPA